jgi:DNA-3-methyladenine glycosylase
LPKRSKRKPSTEPIVTEASTNAAVGRVPPPQHLSIPRPLNRAELPADTIALARYLIGKTVAHALPGRRLSGRIVETEAYPPGDASGHAFRGERRSNRSLFLDRGHAYLYLNYGTSVLLNVTSEGRGIGGGVLIRAVEPLEGIAEMECRRGTRRLFDLTRGPGRLTTAMGIGLEHDGADLCASHSLWLGTAIRPVGEIGQSIRIGISREKEQLRRFFERGNPHVSGPKWLNC